MFIEIILVALIMVKISGRDLSRISKLKIRYPYIIGLAFLGQLASIGLATFSEGWGLDYLGYINVISYLIFLIGLSYNKGLRGFRLLILGSLLNFIPMVFNGGRMPVSYRALERIEDYGKLRLLLDGRLATHSLVTSSTKFKYLIDFIPLARPYIFPKVISIGDIIFSLGMVLFIFSYSNSK